MRSASPRLAGVGLLGCLGACLAAGLALAACAQGETDSTDGLFTAGPASGPDSGGPSTPSSGPHDYGAHDSSAAPPASGDDSGGGGGGGDDSGGGAGGDSGGDIDSGGGGGGVDSAPPPPPPPTGHGKCGNDLKYAFEYAALTTMVPCTDGSECGSTECCYVTIFGSACVAF